MKKWMNILMGLLFCFSAYAQTAGDASFSVYPNPAIDEVMVRIPADKHYYQLSIYNAVGDLVHSVSLNEQQDPKLRIDLSDFQKGVYIVQLQAADTKVTRKLIIK